MATAAEAIVLSSSPTLHTRTPTRASNDSAQLPVISPQDRTPPSSPSSPSERCPSRSRYFAEPTKKAKTKRQPAKTDKVEQDETKAAEPMPIETKATKELGPAILGDLEVRSIDSRHNVAKEPAKKKAVTKKSAATKKATTTKTTGTRTKKAKESENMKITGKVTKANDAPAEDGKKPAKKPSAKGMAKKAESTQSKEPNETRESEHLKLDEAMARRRDWTPPRETLQPDPTPMDATDDAPEARESGSFGKLLSDYNYSGLSLDSREALPGGDAGGPTKRRRIELVDPGLQAMMTGKANASSASSSSTATKKKPKPQKKFTSLTARMTAQYVSTEGSDSELMDDVVPEITKAKSRKKAKPTTKEPEFIVLSPEAAAKALDGQDLIFGTCSQLEREDSPETIRNMQQAILASESQPCSRQSVGCETPTRLGGSRTGTKNLWGIASRDANGSLIQAEKKTTHLSDTSQAPKLKEKESLAASALIADDWLEVDDTPPSRKPAPPPAETSKPIASDLPASSKTATAPANKTQTKAANSKNADSQPPTMPHYPGFTDAELSKQVTSFGFKSVRGRKKMIDLLQKCWESKHGAVETPTEAPQPSQKDESQTEQVASTKVASKAKAKKKTSVSAKEKTVSSQASTLISPKKKAGKPAKSTVAKPVIPSSYADVEEIQDSEDELMLSPSRVQQRYTPKSLQTTQEPALDLALPESPTKTKRRKAPSKASTKKTAALASDINLPDLSAQITKAVRAQPKISPLSSITGSRRNPTWHEKILTYDPIILEDLATWLNVEGLGLIGEDREVNTLDVRKWCESKSICCCWKQNATW